MARPEDRKGLLRLQERKIRVEFRVQNGVLMGPNLNHDQFQDVVLKKGGESQKRLNLLLDEREVQSQEASNS